MAATNGGIRIPVELETKLLDRQLNALLERFTELDEQADKAFAETGDVEYYNRLIEQANELRKEYDDILFLKQQQAEKENKITKELQQQTQYQSTASSEIYGISERLEKLVTQYNSIRKGKIISDKDIEDAERLKEEIKQLVKEYEKLSGGKIKIPGITDEEGNQNQDNTKKMEFNFKSLLKSAKRLALGILGIRGAYMLARRASSAWLSTDEQKQKDMENNWVALGAILSGVIETLTNGFRKLVTGVLYFMSVLTGTNYIQKANDAILRKQAKSTNELAKANNKLIASFDELNVVQSNNNSSNQSDTTGSLIDVNDIGEGARKTLKRIAQALQPVYNMIKGIVDWAKDNPELVIGILGGATLLSFLSKVLGVAGVGGIGGTGLAGILGVLLAIAAIGVITIEIVTIYKSGKETKKSIQQTGEMAESITDMTKETNEQLETLIDNTELEAETVDFLADRQANLVKTSNDMVKARKKDIDSLSFGDKVVGKFIGTQSGLKNELNESTDQLYANLLGLKKIKDTYGLTEEQQAIYREGLKTLQDRLIETSHPFLELSDNMDDNIKQCENLQRWVMKDDEAFAEYTDALKFTNDELKDTNTQGGNVNTKFKDMVSLVEKLTGKKIKLPIEADENPFLNAMRNFTNKLKQNSFTYSIGVAIEKSLHLAKGGIINIPGRGVPVGGAIGGEAGMEGVLPLTDSQQMALLGEAIGRYVTINANITNKMNGRVISRELQKINNQDNFGYNK